MSAIHTNTTLGQRLREESGEFWSPTTHADGTISWHQIPDRDAVPPICREHRAFSPTCPACQRERDAALPPDVPTRQDLIDAYRRTERECERAAADARRLMRRHASWRRSYRAQFGTIPATLAAVWLERIDTAQDHADATAAQLVQLACELIGSEESPR